MKNGIISLICGQVGLDLMHNLFMFYYVKVFLNIFKVDQWWFNFAQVLFLIWNAINGLKKSININYVSQKLI